MIVEWDWVPSDPTLSGFCRDHPGQHCIFSLLPTIEQVELDIGDPIPQIDRVVSVSGAVEVEARCLSSDQSLLSILQFSLFER